MIKPNISSFDPNLDLKLERHVNVTKEKLWRGYTEAELLKQWFCPKPWLVVDAKLDLRPGGEFYTVFQSPEGEQFKNAGCFLEVTPNERLVWTSSVKPGFRPSVDGLQGDKDSDMSFPFTCVITFEAKDGGTNYHAVVMHATPEHRKKHDAMGFQDGWGICLDQLVEVVKDI